MGATHVTRRIRASRAAVYRALVDGEAVARWRVPDDMRAVVHEFEPRVGGRFRVSLTYDDPGRPGKTAGHTDTYGGRFAELVSDTRVVEVIEFETTDPRMQGQMTVTTTLADADGETEVTIEHHGLPPGVAPADNEAGTRMALEKLAGLVEASRPPGAER